MLRLTRCALSRPFGPLGRRIEVDLRLAETYRTEVCMITNDHRAHFNSNVRTRWKMGIQSSGAYAIPRDLGEIPRDYILKNLQRNEPITLQRLFDVIKEKPDCPVDSRRHLRQVLRIARLQSWVYTEKNQTDNRWYYYIHPQKRSAMQGLLRQDRETEKAAEREQAETAAHRIADASNAQSVALDATIQALQRDLIRNVSKIREYEPEYATTLPCSTPSGAINVVWHRSSSPSGQTSATEDQ